MTLLKDFLDFFLHLDAHLFALIQDYGMWIYGILFLIIFVETGLVVMPLLPGDSLLFAAGTFCAGVVKDGETAELNLVLVLILLVIAAILGDGLNYFLGKTVGLKVLQWKVGNRQLVKQKYIDQTHAFYEKHGSKTIIIARFVPIVRTFAPFVAGIGNMSYKKFFKYNVVGGISWVCGLTLLGYFFGNMAFVQAHFETVVFGIVGLSLLPMVVELLKANFRSK
jgi:membrane-associated protein